MITYNNIVNRFEKFVEDHLLLKTFTHGSPSGVDLEKFEVYPALHLVYTGATYESTSKEYSFEVYILDLPPDKAKKIENQTQLVSNAEQVAEDILADMMNGDHVFDFNDLYTVTNASTTPLEETTSNSLAGILLTISIEVGYAFDSCNAPLSGVTPSGSAFPVAGASGLRIVEIDGSPDVSNVTKIIVSNGTLVDNGSGIVTLTTGGGDVDSVNGEIGVVVLDTDDISEGGSNEYYTEARVEANPAVVLNTDKTGITSGQASEITANTAKVGITSTQATEIADNTLKVGITSGQASEISANTLKVGITTQQSSDITANNAKVGITTQQASDITTNNAKVGITPTQASDITTNNAKVGITTTQASDIVTNNAKVSNVQSDWNASTGLAVILNKPTIPSAGVTQILAGTNVTISPTGGTGAVTVNASGGGGGGGIAAVVDDTTPQLGGNLDVQAFQIDTSTTNGNIVVAPNGTGVLEVEGDTNDGAIQLNCSTNAHGVKIQSPSHSAAASYTLVLPDDTGTNGQVLTTDGSGNLSFTTASGGGGVTQIVAGTNVTISPTGGTGVVTIAASGGGGGGGVTSIIAGTNITIDQSTGAVTINATGGGSGGLLQYPLANVSGRFQWSSNDDGETVHIGHSSYGPFNYYNFSTEPVNQTLKIYDPNSVIDVATSVVRDYDPQAYGVYVPNSGMKVKAKVVFRVSNGNALDFGFSVWSCPDPSNGQVQTNVVTLRGRSAAITADFDNTKLWNLELTTTSTISNEYIFILAEQRAGILANTAYVYANISFMLV